MFEVNAYFDGNVKSIAFQGDDLASTVGVMAPGEYTFGTSQNEVMTVISGKLTAKLPGTDNWQTFTSSQSFSVLANSSFNVKIESDTAYLCTYE